MDNTKRPKSAPVTHTFIGPTWRAFHISDKECSNFVGQCTRAYYAGAELHVMEKP